jgi:very-short-patch-repair endonuclease
MSELDRRVVRQGGRHHRIVSGRQLNVIGLDKSAIARRVSEGRLTRLHHCVYLVGPPPPSLHGKWLAAVIACGDGAVLSHRHAAMLWDIRGTDRADVDVTVPGNARRQQAGITVHRTRSLHPDDTTIIDHIPVTSAERTLLDLADVLPPHQLQRAYEQAEKVRIIDHAKLRALAARSNGRRGLKQLLPLLEYDPIPATEAWSELERLFHDLVRAGGLPPYQRNVVIEGDPSPVDACWPQARLVVELQSYEHHSGRDEFERDHAKRARLTAGGHTVLPLTHRQVTGQPAEVVATIEKLLSARSSGGGRGGPGRGSRRRRSPRRTRAAGSPTAPRARRGP